MSGHDALAPSGALEVTCPVCGTNETRLKANIAHDDYGDGHLTHVDIRAVCLNGGHDFTLCVMEVVEGRVYVSPLAEGVHL
jgi:hypothetical protein